MVGLRTPRTGRAATDPTARLPAAVVALALLVAASVAGCAGRGAPQATPTARAPAATRPFLLPPGQGAEGALAVGTSSQLGAGFEALLEGRSEEASRAAEALLVEHPELAAAHVLHAQVAWVAGDAAAAATELAPIVSRAPGYLAAALLLGAADEQLGEVVEAYAAYRGIAASNELAARRAANLRPRALEELRGRIDEALARGNLEAARTALERLEGWAPGEADTLEAERSVAAAAGDPRAELAAVRELAALRPDDEAVRRRQAELETVAGDPGTALRILQQLTGIHPHDAGLADDLARAKFRWRFDLLPAEVRTLADAPALTRADFATLLYWLVPSVRYGKPLGARIATDILDHPDRDTIARVVNLGLMEVDPHLHQFRPDAAVRRDEALASLLRLLATAATPPACLAGWGATSPTLSADVLCDAAARCGLIAEAAGCLSGAELSGPEALELVRRALAFTPVEP